MSEKSDVVIVGGGVIGLTTAYYLAKEGARVVVLERGRPGAEASWAGAGILPPSNLATARTPFDCLRGLSQKLFPDFSAELREATGIDNGYWKCGGLELTGSDPAPLEEEWRGEGVACTQLSERETRELEPELSAGMGSSFWLPDLAQIRNPRHVKALEAACVRAGVRIESDAEVAALEPGKERIEAARTKAGRILGDRFLLCAGAWTEGLLRELGCRTGIRPVRGQIVLLKPAAPVLRHVVMWGAQYLVPRRDGYVLVGSTEEDVGFDRRTTAEAVAHLLELAVRLVPALGQAEVEKSWAGLRPGSPDALPFLGPAPGWDNVWVGAGHFRAGLQLSTGSALLLKEMLLGQSMSLDTSAFRLDRARGGM